MTNNHEHDENCNCNTDDTIIITLDDDTELECEVLEIFEVNKSEYIALIPIGEEEADVLLYKFIEEGEDIFLDVIEDDNEFETVSEEFYQLIDKDEYEIKFEYDDDSQSPHD